jgi:hypothetical protein
MRTVYKGISRTLSLMVLNVVFCKKLDSKPGNSLLLFLVQYLNLEMLQVDTFYESTSERERISKETEEG